MSKIDEGSAGIEIAYPYPHRPNVPVAARRFTTLMLHRWTRVRVSVPVLGTGGPLPNGRAYSSVTSELHALARVAA